MNFLSFFGPSIQATNTLLAKLIGTRNLILHLLTTRDPSAFCPVGCLLPTNIWFRAAPFALTQGRRITDLHGRTK